ncbi:MAG: hypothetical protein LUC92_02565 [Clostridiales bacterium]|nr:hypothetical protein [Clostridiales bacterium]
MKKFKKTMAVLMALTMASFPCLSYGAEETESEGLTDEAAILADETVSDSAVSVADEAEEIVENYSIMLASENNGSSGSLKESIDFTLKVDPSLVTVNGYISEITYNPNAVTPVLMETDILGENCYSENLLDCGVFSALVIEEGKLIICWADADYVALENSIGLANITFDVIPGSEFTENEYGTFTEISCRTYEIARYSDVMADEEFYDNFNFSVEMEG